MANNPEFGKLRRTLFPIHKSELRKFLPLTFIFLMISFNYATLRSLKDIYLMNNISAEVIYYVKLFGVTPGIIFLTIIYSNISKATDRDTRFNIVISYFLIFFGLSYFVFIPNIETFKLNALANSLNNEFPAMCNLWEAIRFWPFTLFYINAEAWGTMALGVLFWTFVNEITGSEQAKRFYSFLSLGAAVGLLLSGTALKSLQKNKDLTLGIGVSLMIMILIVYNFFARDIRSNPALYQVEKKPKKKKEKLSLMESIRFLSKSEYLAQIAILVIAYGVVISLFESVWKAKVKEFTAGDAVMMTNIYGNQGIITGIISMVLILFLSTPIMKRGWRFAASVTPGMALIATLIFFASLYFESPLSGVTASVGFTPLAFAVFFGLLNVVFIKASKYTLFDPTKERAYIPLDEESKVRGKAAVDGVGSRIGKSLGSFVVTLILVPTMGSINNAKYIIFFVILIGLVMWLRAVSRLNVLFKERTEAAKKEAATEKA
ncbi:MAG: Npt1/Npt2 family nucleotide transporter [Bacteroidota bacterium]